jgi:DNA/RNA endonuclease G (NUC1)
VSLLVILFVVSLLVTASLLVAQPPKPKGGPKPNFVPWSYSHDRWQTGPTDILQKWRAYTVSFDGNDDDNGDGKPDRWAIPHWVAYQVKRFPGQLGAGPKRPWWFTDAALFKARIAPADESYAYPQDLKPGFPYDRGHMCPKFTAWRLGANADWNTHYFLNACPQHEDLNQGIWEKLERKVDRWADTYGQVWVVTGPILNGKKPKKWLGEKDEIPVAIPDSFFKIVIKENSAPGMANRPDVLAFIFPNKSIPKKAADHEKYLKSVDEVEAKTGLDFLRKLPAADQAVVEAVKAKALWK